MADCDGHIWIFYGRNDGRYWWICAKCGEFTQDPST